MISSTLAEISKFLTKDVLEEAFRRKTNSKDSVNNIKLTRAAPSGEGHLSAVYRIHVSGYQHATRFIVKGFIGDLVLRSALDCPKYFRREVLFFSKILPVLKEVQASLGAKERIQNNIPNCYCYHEDGVNDYLLLEDLSEANCRSLDEPPTIEQRNGALKTLAHLHAVSMALRIKRPEEFNAIASSVYEVYYSEENRDWFSTYLSNAIDIDRKVMTELEDPDSIYFKKFNDVLSKDIYGQYISSVSTWGDHPVLCHGDAWRPNFLYSRDRTATFDFQLFRCASPATDLSYWIMLCSNESTVVQDFYDSVEVYYSSLVYFLTDMGLDASKVFSRDTLTNELKLYGKYGYLAFLTSLPLMTADKCDILNEKFSGDELIPLESLWRLKPLKNKEGQRLVNAVRVAVDVGII